MKNSWNRIIEVVLIEDNTGDAFLLEEALKETRHEKKLHTFPDGASALAYLRKKGPHAGAATPDLILLDLNLPKMDGREILKELKEDPDLRSIPVIVVTSSSAPADIRNSYMAYANTYIVKPIAIADLRETIRAVEHYWFDIATLPR